VGVVCLDKMRGRDRRLTKANANRNEATVARKLANGLTITTEPLPYLRSVAAGVWIKTGSANEFEAQAGISHFLEHLLFKGTEKRTARELVEAIESQGGQLNAFTSRDYTCLYVKTLDTHVASGIEILCDIIKHSLFCDLEKERNIVLEEIASIEDVPEDYIHELLTEHLWPAHPLGRSVLGTVESVGRFTLDDVRAYYAHWYRPGNLYFSIAGNFDEENVLTQVCNELQNLPPGPAGQRCTVPATGHGVKPFDREIAQDHLCIGFPGASLKDPKRYAFDVLCCALGGGSTSRLFDRVRENEGLAYSVYSFNSAYLASGILGVYAAVAPHNFARTLDITFEEIRKFRDEPMTADELNMNREQIKGNMLMSLENTFVRMARLAKSMMYYDRLVPIEEIVAAVDAVSIEDIQAVAAEAFTPERCAMVALGPLDGQLPETVPL